MSPRFAPPLLVAVLLGACVSQGPFPSLAPREGEQLAIEEPVRVAPVVADDRALRARIEALIAEARAGAAAFDGDFAEAERTAGRGGAEGSDSWIAGQQAISRLEAARGRTGNAAADLDQLNLDRAALPTSAADQQALDEAIAEVARIAANQQARIDRLRR
jgi:hypothetical protein